MNNLPAEGFKQGALTNSTWSVLSWADAAPAPNAIIAAMTSATVTTNMMRLTISATSSDSGRDSSAPLRCTTGPSMKGYKDSFFELVNYYRSVEVCLDFDTCLKIEKFMDNVCLPLGEYMDTLDERGYPLGEQGQRGRDLGRRIMRETQPLRRELIEEFRTILYPPPWYDAPLRWLGRIQGGTRKPTDDETGPT